MEKFKQTVENLSQVRTKLATAAERFTAVPREKTSAGKVEIIDDEDENDVITNDFNDEDVANEKNDITFGGEVLMPLVPGDNLNFESLYSFNQYFSLVILQRYSIWCLNNWLIYSIK